MQKKNPTAFYGLIKSRLEQTNIERQDFILHMAEQEDFLKFLNEDNQISKEILNIFVNYIETNKLFKIERLNCEFLIEDTIRYCRPFLSGHLRQPIKDGKTLLQLAAAKDYKMYMLLKGYYRP